MFNIGGGEVLVILLIALIVLGPDKLPNAARQAGKYLGDFRRMSQGFQRELKDAMDLGDLTDVISGKPTSAGGPTTQPAADTPSITPSTDAAPVAVTPEADTAVDANGADPSASASNGAAANGASAATNAVATNGASTTTNGSSPAPATAGDAPAAVRKRSIEVDGPSASFD